MHFEDAVEGTIATNKSLNNKSYVFAGESRENKLNKIEIKDNIKDNIQVIISYFLEIYYYFSSIKCYVYLYTFYWLNSGLKKWLTIN